MMLDAQGENIVKMASILLSFLLVVRRCPTLEVGKENEREQVHPKTDDELVYNKAIFICTVNVVHTLTKSAQHYE